MNDTPGNPRDADERRVIERDRQQPPPHDGQPDALAGPEPDGIPMTGEEDPLAEVDTDGFGDVVADFATSEKKRD